MAYDPNCYELADYFLDESYQVDRKHLLAGLAQEIQDAIETWLHGLAEDIASDEEDAA